MTHLIRWTPTRTWWDRDPFEEMERYFDAPFDRDSMQWNANRAWNLPLDVIEKEDAYVIHASIPGMDPDDLDVTINDNVLTIRGESQQSAETGGDRYMMRERHYGSFARTISFPTTVDVDHIEASCEQGELTLRLPKAENARLRRISVGRGPRTIDVPENNEQIASGSTAQKNKGNGSHGWAEGQATSDGPSSERNRNQQHWTEGQTETPGAQTSRSAGWTEGQKEMTGAQTPSSVGWAEGQATKTK